MKLLWRIFGAAGVWLSVAVITFALTYLVPADPARAIAGPKADAATIAHIRAQLGLNAPLWLRFGHFLGGILHGDFGKSYVTGLSVLPTLLARFPATLELALGAMAVYLLVGASLGIAGGIAPRSPVARFGRAFASSAIAMPAYWLGIVLLYVFAKRLPVLPAGGYGGLDHLILPAVALGTAGAAYYHNLLATTMREQMGSEYVRTARAKGLSGGTVVLRHALRNALLPLVTLLGYDLANLLGGVVLTEGVFGWPGIGQLALQAIDNLDVPMIMGTVLFAATLIVAMNLLVDALYGILDPRLR